MNKTKSGVALVMVLLLLMLLVTLVGQFSYTVKVDAYVAQNSGIDMQLRYALASAVNQAVAQLLLDMRTESEKNKYDCLLDEWAKPMWNTQKPGKVGLAEVTYKIVDENTKYNLLMLLQPKYPSQNQENTDKQNEGSNGEGSDTDDQENEDNNNNNNGNKPNNKSKPKPITPQEHFDLLLSILQKDVVIIEPTKLREAIQQWMKEKRGKPDNATGPFPVKLPMLSIKELGMIKGIDRQWIDNIAGINRGLSNYMTVWSDGKININTASAEVLQSLNPKITPEIAQEIVKHRENPGIDGEIQTFQNISDLKKVEGLGVEREKLYADIADLITVQSSFFTIIATATIGRTTRKMTVVAWRRGLHVFRVFCDYQ